jgi:hypothetical protein
MRNFIRRFLRLVALQSRPETGHGARAFDTLRRSGFGVLRRCDLVGLPPALERRRIAHPKGLGLRRFSKLDYSRDLRPEELGPTVICESR